MPDRVEAALGVKTTNEQWTTLMVADLNQVMDQRCTKSSPTALAEAKLSVRYIAIWYHT